MEHTTHPFAPSATQARGIKNQSPELLSSLMHYKRWADAELVKAALAAPDLPEPERGYVTALIRHYHTVDCIFRAHLLGIPHDYTSANPAEPATLPELHGRVSSVDDWYVNYTQTLDERDLGEVLHVTFTDGQEQALTRSDILVHVALHGAGHRAQVSLLIPSSSVK